MLFLRIRSDTELRVIFFYITNLTVYRLTLSFLCVAVFWLQMKVQSKKYNTRERTEQQEANHECRGPLLSVSWLSVRIASSRKFAINRVVSPPLK